MHRKLKDYFNSNVFLLTFIGLCIVNSSSNELKIFFLVLIWFKWKMYTEHRGCPKSNNHGKLTRKRRSNSIDITVTTLWQRCSYSSGFMRKSKKSRFIRLCIINSKHDSNHYLTFLIFVLVFLPNKWGVIRNLSGSDSTQVFRGFLYSLHVYD